MTQRGAKEEVTTQKTTAQGTKGGKEIRGQGASKRAHITPERLRRGSTKAAQGKQARVLW